MEQEMHRTTDRFGLASDEGAQIATVKAGWRFYQRAAARDDAQQALEEWIDAIEAVLDLGVEPSRLVDFRDHLAEARGAAEAEDLKRRIRTLIATLTPHPLHGARASLRAMLDRLGGPGEPPAVEDEAVAVDLGVGPRAATHVSVRLRDAA